jgi:hypothetical protein
VLARALLWASIVLGALLSLAACYGIATENLIVGSRDGAWYYGYGASFSLRFLAVFGAVGLVLGILLVVFDSGRDKSDWVVLLSWIVAATALHYLIRSFGPYTVEEIFVSDEANAFYGVAQRYDPATVLKVFDWVRERGPLHAQSNMPGKVLLIHALQLISTHPAVLAWLLIALSNLGAILVYVVSRDLVEDRKVALGAATLYLFMPARVFFFPLMNTVTPLWILGCTALLLQWLRTGRTRYAVVLGIAFYGLVFFEPLPLVMGLLFAALSIRAIVMGSLPWDRFAAQTTLMTLVFVAAGAVVATATGFELLTTVRELGHHAVTFNETWGRSYDIWIRANLWEFVIGIGVCQAVVFVGALAYSLSGPQNWRERLRRPIFVVAVALVAVLAAIDLIGVNRGEVIRLWIFLGCFFQLPTAYACATLGGRLPIAVVLLTSALQAVLGASMIRFVVP